jgi:quercetin dioxygenase-like cupin family protein
MVTVKKVTEVPGSEVGQPGVQGVRIKRLIGMPDRAPTFAMRLFEVGPGGYTPLHTHAHEHEVFILSGRGLVRGSWGERPLVPETAVYVPSGVEHHFLNSGDEPFRFLCLVPLKADR